MDPVPTVPKNNTPRDYRKFIFFLAAVLLIILLLLAYYYFFYKHIKTAIAPSSSPQQTTYNVISPIPVNSLTGVITAVDKNSVTVLVNREITAYPLANNLTVRILTRQAPVSADLINLKPGDKVNLVLDSSGKTITEINILSNE